MPCPRRIRSSRASAARLLCAAVLAAALAVCATAPTMNQAERARAVGPWEPARRVEAWRTVDRLAVEELAARRHVGRNVVTSVSLEGGRLELASFRSDRRVDQFALYAPGANDTSDFGYLFDVAGRGRFDWIVFVGGPMLWNDGSMGFMDYHAIDTDGDGRVDVLVFNAVAPGGGRQAEAGVSAWLYDRDHDGVLDDGEYLGPDGSRPVPRDGDELVLVTWSGPQRISTRVPDQTLRLFSEVLAQANAASAAAGRPQ